MPMEAGRTIPKFGAWDVNNPSSADGFTVIFGKARDEKKAPATVPGPGKLQYNKINRPTDDIKDARAERINPSYNSSSSSSSARANGSKKWFCCVSPSPTQP